MTQEEPERKELNVVFPAFNESLGASDAVQFVADCRRCVTGVAGNALACRSDVVPSVRDVAANRLASLRCLLDDNVLCEACVRTMRNNKKSARETASMSESHALAPITASFACERACLSYYTTTDAASQPDGRRCPPADTAPHKWAQEKEWRGVALSRLNTVALSRLTHRARGGEHGFLRACERIGRMLACSLCGAHSPYESLFVRDVYV